MSMNEIMVNTGERGRAVCPDKVDVKFCKWAKITAA